MNRSVLLKSTHTIMHGGLHGIWSRGVPIVISEYTSIKESIGKNNDSIRWQRPFYLRNNGTVHTYSIILKIVFSFLVLTICFIYCRLYFILFRFSLFLDKCPWWQKSSYQNANTYQQCFVFMYYAVWLHIWNKKLLRMNGLYVI